MKKPINILSIDWDYFIDATTEQRIMWFPDGNDNLGSQLNNYIWAVRYSEYNIEQVGILQKEFDELKNYLISIKSNAKSINCKTMTTNSHKFIYDFVAEKLKEENYTIPIRMLHIDYHTDSYGCNSIDDKEKPVDCGNWCNYLEKLLNGRTKKFSKISWLGREDSDEYEVSKNKIMECINLNKVKNLQDFINSYFHNKIPDMIFLCRSNPWSPPHLDNKFEEIYNIMIKIGIAKYSSDIESIRYDYEFKELVDSIRKENERIMNFNHKNIIKENQ